MEEGDRQNQPLQLYSETAPQEPCSSFGMGIPLKKLFMLCKWWCIMFNEICNFVLSCSVLL